MKRTALIIAAVVLLILLAVAGYLLFAPGGGLKKADQERLNTLRLAREYMEREEYERSLSLLDKLLLADPEDEEANALLDEVLRRKKAR